MLEGAQELLTRVVQYVEPLSNILMVCKHPAQNIALPKYSTNIKSKQLLPDQCNYTEIWYRIQPLRNDGCDATRRHGAPGTDIEL